MERYIKLFAFIALICCVTGCGVTRGRFQPVQRDSTVVRYYDSLRIKDSVVMVSLPIETSSQVVYQSDTSHLETSVATSDAWIDSLGRIHHNLQNRSDKQIPVIVPIIERARGSEHTQQLVITRTVEIEKKLTLWQRFMICVGKGALIVILLVAIYFTVKTISKYKIIH